MPYELHDTATHDSYSAGTSSLMQTCRLATSLERHLKNAPMPPALQRALRGRVLDVTAVVALLKVCGSPDAAAAAVEGRKLLFLAHAHVTRLRARTNGALRHAAAKQAAAARRLFRRGRQ